MYCIIANGHWHVHVYSGSLSTVDTIWIDHKVSWCLYFRGSLVHTKDSLGTVRKCPDYRGVIISECLSWLERFQWHVLTKDYDFMLKVLYTV